MKNIIIYIIALTFALIACTKVGDDSVTSEGGAVMNIDKKTIETTIKALIEKYGEENKFRIEKGVNQTAALWMEVDGTPKDFEEFCMDKFVAKEEDLEKLFMRLSENFEVIWGHNNKVMLDLNRPVHLTNFEMIPIDEIFAAYSPGAHINDDFFKNKIAFHILLNFPHYSLDEKTKLSVNWSRKDWAYARMGDVFVSRVPSALLQKQSEAVSNADLYISQYNIFMDKLVDESGKSLFPADMKLISHWGLRDELKSNYANKETGLEKQKTIYEVMKHIIAQDIPKSVINNNAVTWNPFANKVWKNGKEEQIESEPNTRYQHVLNIFNALSAIDKYSPSYPTYISRKFDEEFEIPQQNVEKLFTDFASSPLVKEVAKLIEKRLGRKLQPWDIWYDGFKSRSAIPEDMLNGTTTKKYPTPAALKADLPNILAKLGFAKDKAQWISSRIEVDPSRGAGHAWGAQMKSEYTHLRTRISDKGMDYKGYNIATHELGHNVEQTLTLNDVDYYMLTGVPNTAFTEAWAFIFQKKDLELLGIKEDNPDKKALMTLDNFWSTLEIMSVSLVDMNLWKWLYANPDANAEQTKEATIRIAKEVWNKYYADIFGVKDQPILAIYSHMIDNPLYLSAYPLGHLIEFQIESFIEGKNLGTEMMRMCSQGRILPQSWMKGSVGQELSIQPTLEATKKALESFK